MLHSGHFLSVGSSSCSVHSRHLKQRGAVQRQNYMVFAVRFVFGVRFGTVLRSAFRFFVSGAGCAGAKGACTGGAMRVLCSLSMEADWEWAVA